MGVRTTDSAEVLRVLARHNVDFIIVGGQAAVLLGSPIVTWDFDACYQRSSENLRRLAAALRDLHARLRVAGMSDEEAEDLPFALDAQTLEAGLNFTFQTRAGAVDLLGQPAGVLGYDELIRNALDVEVYGVRVKVCALEDLMTMKRHAGRPKDLAQLAELTALRDELERRDAPTRASQGEDNPLRNVADALEGVYERDAVEELRSEWE